MQTNVFLSVIKRNQEKKNPLEQKKNKKWKKKKGTKKKKGSGKAMRLWMKTVTNIVYMLNLVIATVFMTISRTICGLGVCRFL